VDELAILEGALGLNEELGFVQGDYQAARHRVVVPRGLRGVRMNCTRH
jgi:hypothetical protein